MQELDLVEQFILNCNRSSDSDFEDPMLAELCSLSPQALLESGARSLLPNMIQYFNKTQVKKDLEQGLGSKEELKRRVAAALGKPILGVDNPFMYFGVSPGGHMMFQATELAPITFNVSNSIAVKLIPKLAKLSQKYSNDQGQEDYI